MKQHLEKKKYILSNDNSSAWPTAGRRIYPSNSSTQIQHMNMYPKVSGLAAWSENCKWYSSLPLDAGVSLFCESV
jgi:hypothetical protein